MKNYQLIKRYVAMGQEKADKLYSLITLEDFKAVLGIDDREDKLTRFCLVTATHTIEEYCKRRLLRKRHFEWNEYKGDLLVPLREYPVISISSEQLTMNNTEIPHPCGISVGSFFNKKTSAKAVVTAASMPLDPKFYRVIPDCGSNMNFPYSIELSNMLKRHLEFHRRRGSVEIRVVYWAGYAQANVPADLSAACLELASWNMNRYKGRRVGMTGNVRGGGKDGEHFEASMPLNVKQLLEPHRRKTI
jgi:hypothetical protein